MLKMNRRVLLLCLIYSTIRNIVRILLVDMYIKKYIIARIAKGILYEKQSG